MRDKTFEVNTKQQFTADFFCIIIVCRLVQELISQVGERVDQAEIKPRAGLSDKYPANKMRGPVVDWDLDKLVEEYGAREKLTPEEDKQLEEDLVKYVNEFEIEELKEENEQLKEKVDELTSKAEEETNKKEKAEAEAEQGKEMIKMLERRLESMNVAKREVRREQRASRGEEPLETCSRVGRRRRVRCWDLSRPGGCQYGARCRYLHPVEEVRAEDCNTREEGECRILGVEEQMRRRQEQQDFYQAQARVRRWREGQQPRMMMNTLNQQPMMMMNTLNQQHMMMMNKLNQQQHMMNQQKQWQWRMRPSMVYGHQQ